MKKLYLLLAIIGAIAPYFFFIQFIEMEGPSIMHFIYSLFVNGATIGFTIDLVISSLVFWLFMFQQLKQSNKPNPYLFILLNLTVGLSCALPAYFYARERNH